MDKNEFKTRYDEIKQLIKEGKTEEALDIVESTNWRKVHNVNALVKASEVCEEMGQLEEARELLYMAHERSPIGRMILYHLAILSVKMDDLEEAERCYEEFVKIAPHDSLKYIIKYRISKGKGADNTTLIGILEELKEDDFREEWAYELAYLYHKTMQVEKCIELCDEIILWFGDGPYVERALEMKMIYQPLDKAQEDKYRHFQQKRDGVTEIRANEYLQSGEIIHETMAIPQVELPAERFNTVNLQAEIKKNIDEIMRATEAEAVSENMENIKNLVEEIPYLQVSQQSEMLEAEQLQATQEINLTLKDTFKGYLAEEYDGQISLLVPESKEVERQIDGQMTIEDVMEEWEKTRRAAEATLQEAQQQQLASAKNIALKEATEIMDRLEEAIPRLDAGTTPAQLLKEEYMGKKEETKVFHIPGLTDAVPSEEGLSIPIVDPDDVRIIKGELESEDLGIVKPNTLEDTKDWQPPELDETGAEEETMVPDEQGEVESDLEEVTDVDYKEASKIVAGVNEMLQQEIDRIMADEIEPEIDSEESRMEVDLEEAISLSEDTPEEEDIVIRLPQDILDELKEQETDSEELPAQTDAGEVESPLVETEVEEKLSVDPVEEEPEEDPQVEEESVEESQETSASENEQILTEDTEERTTEEILEAAMKEISEEIENEVQEEFGENAGEETAQEILPEISEVTLEPEEMAELVDESVLERAISEELPEMELTEEEKGIFSYFMPIGGMESSICQALTGTRYRLENRKNSASGNIIIQGGIGSGKTMLASNMIKVLQMETGSLSGNVGKIDAEQLNKKDVALVLSKVVDGCLIIEGAGSLSDGTQETLRQLMSQENYNVLVVMEDQKSRMDKMLAVNHKFAAMFTEKITIPVFTIDELVNFGKVYALEEGYVVDEMAILAMYNRINLIQRVDHPTSLIEVRDIVEAAIDHAEKGGIKAMLGRLGAKRYDEEGNLILREQDFEA